MLPALLAILLQALAAPAPPAASPNPAAAPSTMANPDWIRRPDGEDIMRYYPEAAQRQNLPGRATISCQVLASGALTGCVVMEESPAGVGFGEAAVKMGALF